MSPVELARATYDKTRSLVESQIMTGEPELPMARRLFPGSELSQDDLDALTFCTEPCQDCPLRNKDMQDEVSVTVKAGEEFSVIDVSENQTLPGRIAKITKLFIYKYVGLETVSDSIMQCERPVASSNPLTKLIGRKACGAAEQLREGAIRDNRIYKY